MECYELPQQPRAVCFDIDKTLYTNDEYAGGQITVLIERLAAELGVSSGQANERVEQTRQEIRREGGEASLGNTFLRLGIPMETSVAWRLALIHPGDFLKPDAKLHGSLRRLRNAGMTLVALTNNPVGTGSAALSALGVLELFTVVAGLDTTMRSKPDPAPFRWVLRSLALPASDVVFVGDRYGVDLEPALALGAGGILVSGVEEVYQTPGVLLCTPGGGA